jgi:5,10-methylenetetrahydrofolate reductase
MAGSFKDALNSGEFVITSEIGPPKGTDIEEMKHNIELVKDKVHGLNMTDNQSSVMRLSSLAGCVIIKQMGGVPILQMTGRDRNRIALQSDLISASVLGIANACHIVRRTESTSRHWRCSNTGGCACAKY